MSWANKIAFALICFIVVFTTLAYGTVHQPVVAVFYFLVATLLVLWAADGFVSGSVRYSSSLLQLPLIAAGVYALIQVVPFGSIGELAGVQSIPRTISIDPFSTKVTALHFFVLAVFFAVTLACLHSTSRIRKTVTLIIVFGFLYAFYAILQSVLSPTKIYGVYESRFAVPFGSFVNRHNFAAYMEMAMSLPLGLLFTGAVRKDKRLLYITATAIMGIALVLSGSRGGFVALVAAIALFVLLTTLSESGKSRVTKAALAALLIGIVVAGTFFVGGESSLTRFAETVNSEDITTNRTHIWQVTLAVIARHMPLGAGFGAFGVAYTPFDTYSGLERVEQAHNDYLQVLADAGLVGMLIGGLFLYLLVRTGLKNIRSEDVYRRGVAVGAFVGCFAVLVHSIFDFVLHTTAISVLFLTLAALLVASGSSEVKGDARERGDRRDRRSRNGSIAPFSKRGTPVLGR